MYGGEYVADFSALHVLFTDYCSLKSVKGRVISNRRFKVGYLVKEEDLLFGEVRRRGPFVTEQEARMELANAVEQAYDFNPQLAMANVRQEVEDAVRDGRKDCCDAKGNLVCRYSIEPT